MCWLVTQLLIQTTLVAGESASYESAYNQTRADGLPLLVLVGADWCPGCRAMKHGVLARMQAGGQLSGVHYAQVDIDSESRLADRLMSGSSIPQLIVFSQGPDGTWRRLQVTGATSETDVTDLIHRATAGQRPRTHEGGVIGN
jgi:thiol:disulfide interchange protein